MKRTYCDECGERITHKDTAMIDGKGFVEVAVARKKPAGFKIQAQIEHIQERIIVNDDSIDLCEKCFKDILRRV